MKYLLVFTLVLLPPLASCTELGAVTRQMVRPVLIRNEHNSLLQLTINAKRPFVQLKAIAVELEGAMELESLQFYFTDVDDGLSTQKPFGEQQYRLRLAAFTVIETVQAAVAVGLDDAHAIGCMRRPCSAEVACHGDGAKLRRALCAAV